MAVQCPRGPLPKCCYYCRSEEHLVAECPARRRAVAREKSAGTGTRVSSSEAETLEREWAATTESGVWGEPEPEQTLTGSATGAGGDRHSRERRERERQVELKREEWKDERPTWAFRERRDEETQLKIVSLMESMQNIGRGRHRR